MHTFAAIIIILIDRCKLLLHVYIIIARLYFYRTVTIRKENGILFEEIIIISILHLLHTRFDIYRAIAKVTNNLATDTV